MLKVFAIGFFWITLIGNQSCATMVMDDYPQYLQNNANTLQLPKNDYKIAYSMDSNAQQHQKKIRSFAAGAANSWTIEFAPMLEATLNSADLKQAFAGISKDSESAAALLEFKLGEYDFRDHRAVIRLDVTATRLQDNKQLFTKTYESKGKSQGGKMFFAGAFGMKNAIQQSTKMAMDDIVTNIVSDLNKHLGKGQKVSLVTWRLLP